MLRFLINTFTNTLSNTLTNTLTDSPRLFRRWSMRFVVCRAQVALEEKVHFQAVQRLFDLFHRCYWATEHTSNNSANLRLGNYSTRFAVQDGLPQPLHEAPGRQSVWWAFSTRWNIGGSTCASAGAPRSSAYSTPDICHVERWQRAAHLRSTLPGSWRRPVFLAGCKLVTNTCTDKFNRTAFVQPNPFTHLNAYHPIPYKPATDPQA